VPCHALEGQTTEGKGCFSRKLRRARGTFAFSPCLMRFLTVIDMYGSFFWWTNSSGVHRELEDETARLVVLICQQQWERLVVGTSIDGYRYRHSFGLSADSCSMFSALSIDISFRPSCGSMASEK
jgi:hypothetical protein